jgi:hypothetical protein
MLSEASERRVTPLHCNTQVETRVLSRRLTVRVAERCVVYAIGLKLAWLSGTKVRLMMPPAMHEATS